MKRILGAGFLVMACGFAAFGCENSSNDGGTVDAGPTGLPDAGGGSSQDGATPPTNECAAVTGAGTTHSGSVQTETWTAAGSPHILPYDTTVYGTLTLEPCAEVRIAAGKTIDVRNAGAIVSEGTATKPITITKKDAAPFASIVGGGNTLSFAYTTISGGGDPLNAVADYPGVINLQGADQTLPTQGLLKADHLTIDGSASNGIVLRTGAGFDPASHDVTIKGAAQYPISIWSRAVGTVPTGTYTGNTHDEIVLPGSGGYESVQEDATMHDRGVPYRIGLSNSGGTLYVSSGKPSVVATLTIEAGVTVRAKKGGVIYVEFFTGDEPATGALVAQGTAAKPIVFTSAEAAPAAGDWLGVYFGKIPSATSKIDYAKVQYAGGDSSSGGSACNTAPVGKTNDGAIRIFGGPAAQFVTNTSIENSASNGIDRGWRSDSQPDFLPTNTFTNIGRCKQTTPRASNGGCPDPVVCD